MLFDKNGEVVSYDESDIFCDDLMRADEHIDPAAAHRLQLEGREKLTVAGVEDVERFDDQCIVLRTGAGVLVVSGESLHIGKLSLDGGELHVDGRIDALTYEDAPETRGGGLFSRLFG